MPKIKLPTKTPVVDMTPMVDLFALLLTFFMLTATVRVSEPAPVDTPSSVSEKTTPDFNQMTIVISKDGRVFFNIDNGIDTILAYRPKILAEMGKQYNIEFTPEELRIFQKGTVSMGVPIDKMKEFLNSKEPGEKDALQTGVPVDSLNNQLASWVLYSRKINPNVQATIKGDNKAEFPIVKRVLDILQDKNVNRFNLITNLEAVKVTAEANTH
ncbi:MAG: biopolymer transporter ExbD [Odoribacter sp.]|nr:biopolymer transporter ExbD [Odoribacter sp.]